MAGVNNRVCLYEITILDTGTDMGNVRSVCADLLYRDEQSPDDYAFIVGDTHVHETMRRLKTIGVNFDRYCLTTRTVSINVSGVEVGMPDAHAVSATRIVQDIHRMPDDPDGEIGWYMGKDGIKRYAVHYSSGIYQSSAWYAKGRVSE